LYRTQHACCDLAQLGDWLGLAQPMWAKLGPAPKNIKIKIIKNNNKIEIEIACIRNKKINVFYFILFTDTRIKKII